MLMEQPIQRELRRRRPFGVYVIIALELIVALILGVSLAGNVMFDPYLRAIVRDPVYYAWIGWALFGSLLVAVVGMLRLKRWGWVLTMFLTGINLLLSIWSYFQGEVNYIAMLVNIVIVFYLNLRDVQAPFVRRNSKDGEK